MPERDVALLFDRNHNRNVLVEVGDSIDGFTVDSIDDDVVTLVGKDGARVVLVGPGGTTAGTTAATTQPPAAPGTAGPPATAMPADPYAAPPVTVSPTPATTPPVYVAPPVVVVPAPTISTAQQVPGTPLPGATQPPITISPSPAISGPQPPPAVPPSTTTPPPPTASPATSIPMTPMAPAGSTTPPAPTTPMPPTASPSTSAPMTPLAPAGSTNPPAPPSVPSAAILQPADPYAAVGPTPAPRAQPQPVVQAQPPRFTPPPPPPGAVELRRAEVDAALADFTALSGSIGGAWVGSGLRVDVVAKGSLFERAGLRSGDVVAAVDGKPLRSLDDAADLYARAPSLRAVSVQVVRGGKPTMLQIAIR